MKFKEHSLGLYVHDAASSNTTKDKILKEQVLNYSLLSTVAANEINYTSREIKRAQQALDLYRRLARPSKAVSLSILDKNLIYDSGITFADAKLAVHIYRKDPATLMEKTRRTKPPAVPKLQFVPLPDSIMDLYKHVTISIDVFVLNGVKFFHSISDSIKLRTVEALPNESEATLVSCVKKVINLINLADFKSSKHVVMDNSNALKNIFVQLTFIPVLQVNISPRLSAPYKLLKETVELCIMASRTNTIKKS